AAHGHRCTIMAVGPQEYLRSLTSRARSATGAGLIDRRRGAAGGRVLGACERAYGTAWPASAPVGRAPSTATWPLTTTYGMPTGNWQGSSYVAVSITRSGSITTRSAEYPRARRPRPRRLKPRGGRGTRPMTIDPRERPAH